LIINEIDKKIAARRKFPQRDNSNKKKFSEIAQGLFKRKRKLIYFKKRNGGAE